MFGAAHILSEVRWLLNSATQWSRIDKQPWLLRAILPDHYRAFAIDEESHDGSWGVRYVGWLKRLGPMIQAINGMTGKDIPPTYSELKLSKLGDWAVVHRIDGEMRKATALRFAYHVAAYRKGEVAHSNRVVATTLALHDLESPYGWQRHSTMTDHNAYDVVRILEYGWQLRGHTWNRQRRRRCAAPRLVAADQGRPPLRRQRRHAVGLPPRIRAARARRW